MEAKEKIIVALDVPTIEEAKRLVVQLYPYVGGFKVGLELLTSEGAPEVVRHLHDMGGRYYFAGKWEGNESFLFYDGKFMDIPNTVAGAARAVTRLGVKMFNVHCMAGVEAMKAVKEAAKKEADFRGWPRPLILGVTLLTSLNSEELNKLKIGLSWYEAVKEEGWAKQIVVNLALAAQNTGLDGVVTSPQEIKLVRKHCGSEFLVVTPAIRPIWAEAGDQERIDTPAAAIKAGADYLVIGRPITQSPKEPVEAVKRIIEEIENVL